MAARRADYLIVGGGITGCGVACYLTALGAKNVVVLERDAFLGTGATAKSAAAVRHLFTSEVNVRLSMRSLDVFERFEESFGVNPALIQNGYLFCATSDAAWARLQESTAFQKRLGARVELVSPDDMLKIVPQLEVSDVRGGSFGPRDGYIDPNSVMMGFAQCAKARGARFEMETEAAGVRVEGGVARGVETSRGFWESPVVVNAAGPHAAALGRTAGAEVPIAPYRRMLVTTKPFKNIAEKLPLVIDMANGWYCRREAGGVMMGMANPNESPGFVEEVDWEWVEKMIEAGVRRMPVLAQAELDRAWAGLYDITPDHHAVIGEVTGIRGFYMAAGFSGHGIMHSPAACEALAQIILTGRSDVDVRALRFSRFAEGDLRHETAVI